MMEKSALAGAGGRHIHSSLSLIVTITHKVAVYSPAEGQTTEFTQSGNFRFQGVHFIMMEKSALACEDGGVQCTPTPFNSIVTITYKVALQCALQLRGQITN
jgi:hypothetical protein